MVDVSFVEALSSFFENMCIVQRDCCRGGSFVSSRILVNFDSLIGGVVRRPDPLSNRFVVRSPRLAFELLNSVAADIMVHHRGFFVVGVEEAVVKALRLS